MATEIEAKFLGIDPEILRKKLSEAWFVRETPEFLMTRKTFHMPSYGTREWVRVRREATKVTMTYKKSLAETVDGTEEIEIVVDDFDRACSLLERTGLTPSSHQENYREVWTRNGVEACIDRWPGLRPYVEIEAATADAVAEAAALLGYDIADASYGGTQKIYENELGIDPDVLVKLPRITFDDPPRKR